MKVSRSVMAELLNQIATLRNERDTMGRTLAQKSVGTDERGVIVIPPKPNNNESSAMSERIDRLREMLVEANTQLARYRAMPSCPFTFGGTEYQVFGPKESVAALQCRLDGPKP